MENRSRQDPDSIIHFEGERQFQLLNIHYQNPEYFLHLISNKKITKLVKKVLNDKFILSNFNASRAKKSQNKNYRLHIDSRKPMSEFKNTFQIVANICIDDFTSKNGSTVVVPKSHLSGNDPRNENIQKDKILATEASKGSVVFTLGQTWHDIGNNISGDRRWSIIAYYSCWWCKPTYDFVNTCNKEIFSKLTSFEKELLGFTTKPPIDWRSRQKTVCNPDDLPPNYEDARNWDGSKF